MFENLKVKYYEYKEQNEIDRFERKKRQITYENISKRDEKRNIRVIKQQGHTRYEVKKRAGLYETLRKAHVTFLPFWLVLIGAIAFEWIGSTIGGLPKYETLQITYPFLIVTFGIGLIYAYFRYRYMKTHMRFIVARHKQTLLETLYNERTETAQLSAKQRAMYQDIQDHYALLFAPTRYEQAYGTYRNDEVENEPKARNPFDEYVIAHQLDRFKRICQMEHNGQLHEYANMMAKTKRRTTRNIRECMRDVFEEGGFDRSDVIQTKEKQYEELKEADIVIDDIHNVFDDNESTNENLLDEPKTKNNVVAFPTKSHDAVFPNGMTPEKQDEQ